MTLFEKFKSCSLIKTHQRFNQFHKAASSEFSIIVMTCCFSNTKPVVLKLFCMFYPFNKDDYQIYPQYIKWCSFIKKTKEAIYISYN